MLRLFTLFSKYNFLNHIGLEYLSSITHYRAAQQLRGLVEDSTRSTKDEGH